MHHRARMRIGNGLGGIDEVSEQLEPLSERAGLRQRGLERPSADQLLGGVKRAVRTLRELVDGDDSGVIELRREPRLAEEAGPGRARARRLAVPRKSELLERHLPPHEAVQRTPDDRLSTPAQLVQPRVLSLGLDGNDLRFLDR